MSLQCIAQKVLSWKKKSTPSSKINGSFDEGLNVLTTSEDVMKLKFEAQSLYDAGRIHESAERWFRLQNQNFNQSALLQYKKRRIKKKLETGPISCSEDDLFDEDEEEERESIMISSLSSPYDSSRLSSELPPNWRVVQINVEPTLNSLYPNTKKDLPLPDSDERLFISTAQNGFIDVIRAPTPRRETSMPTVFSEFYSIVQIHSCLYKVENKETSRKKYFQTRDEIENRLGSLLEALPSSIIGYGSAWLLGQPVEESRSELLRSTAEKILEPVGKLQNRTKERLIKMLDYADLVSDRNLEQFIEICDIPSSISEEIRKFGVSHPGKDCKRHPVILLLGSDVHQLPWDSLPLFRTNPVSRAPSLIYLTALYKCHSLSKKSVLKKKKDRSKMEVYYILNPDQSLIKTQNRLETFFKEKLGPDGRVGEHPSFNELVEALSLKDGFMYCGHGSQLKNLSQQKLESLNVHAMAILMGCGSGQLKKLGRTAEPIGTPNSYMIAAAPALLGFLWSVTDRDIDEWTTSFLKFWFDEKNAKMSLVEAVAKQKKEFKKLINGAATVVHGLPSLD